MVHVNILKRQAVSAGECAHLSGGPENPGSLA